MSTQPKTFLTPEQYLEIERKAEYKSQYWRGEMFAMAGASANHNSLAVNLVIDVGGQLRGRDCRAYGSDMRVQTSPDGLYTYPDLSVVCGKPKLADSKFDTLENPTLIAEILSASTEGYDRGEKFEQYRSISSLKQYLLVTQDRAHVELYTRQPDGQWLLCEASGLDQFINLDSIGCRLALEDLYDKVDFTATGT